MRFISLGGGNEVGASCYLLELDGKRILVDAGIRVGGNTEAGLNKDSIPDLALLQEHGGVDAILVTHAHLDHTGSLPLVHQAYSTAPIFATTPTTHLMRVLLADTLKIMEIKAEQEMECPLYSADLVTKMFTRVVAVNMGATVNVTDNIKATFFPAGHIMGAAMIGIEGREGRVLFTGDISIGGQRTIPGMVNPKFKPHLMIMESTYGNRLHANRQREEKGLAEAVAEVITNGGHALIPAFALGRAQEVILLIQAFQQANRIPKFPIWVDGMVRSVCDTYVNFPEYLNGPVKRIINNGGNPFYREKATARPVLNTAQREKILTGPPSCIISSSGMLTGGPSQFYATRLAENEKNAIILCGYQDEESPGHKLMKLVSKLEKELTLGDKVVSVKCRIDKYGLSAHADSGELAALVESLKPKRIILVHGDDDARSALCNSLSGSHSVFMAENGEPIDFFFKKVSDTSLEKVNTPVNTGLGKGIDIDLRTLWEHLVKINSNKQKYTVQDLAIIWYGPEVTPEQQEYTGKLINEGQSYFVSDWKHPYFYNLKSPEQVALRRQREVLMRELKNKLPGHLVLTKDTNNAVRAGICFAVAEDGFEVWKVGQKGTLHTAENLLEIIDTWQYSSEEPIPGEEKVKLHQLITNAKTVFRKIKPLELWQLLSDVESVLSVEDILKLLGLANNTVNRLALSWRLNTHPDIFKRMNDDDLSVAYSIKVKELPEVTEEEIELTERMEQNAAFKLLEELLPPDSGLYRKSIENNLGKLTLSFEFPEVAGKKFADLLNNFATETGWDIGINSEPHQGALLEFAKKVIPQGITLLKNPSFHRDVKQVMVKLDIPHDYDIVKIEEAKRLFNKHTGYSLEVNELSKSFSKNIATANGIFEPTINQLEINKAFSLIKEKLTKAGIVVYKTSKKDDYILVSFISPQVGSRYSNIIEDLIKETGWNIVINPEPNQNEIISIVRKNIPVSWGMKKTPGIFKERMEVQVKLVDMPEDNDPVKNDVMQKIENDIGYKLVLKQA